MKICQIPASRRGLVQDGRNLKISPTLQLLFGATDSDTTAIRDGIRKFFFGEETLIALHSEISEIEVSMNSGSSTGTRFVDGIRLGNPDVIPEWKRILNEIDLSTFQSFLEVNFGQVEPSGAQICFQLNRRFNAPFGDVGLIAGKDSVQTQVSALKSEVATINLKISSCRSESEHLRSRLEELESQQSRPVEFDAKQREALCNRIAKLEEKLERQQDAAYRLDEEIELAIRSAVPSHDETQIPSARKSSNGISDQLHRIDAQIDRWKNIKNDVNERLTEIKSDLGCSRVAEFDGMLEDIRAVNQLSESKLLDLLDGVSLNEQSKREIQEILELNHQICDGVALIQESWRHDISNSEMESLNRCSTELDGYLDYLARKKSRIEGRGQNQSGKKKCHCKSHVPGVRVDVQRIEEMKLQQAEVLKEVDVTAKALGSAKRELECLDSFADSHNQIDFVRERIRECNEEHSDLQDEKDRVLNRIRFCMEGEQQNSHLVRLISGYFSELTDGQFRRLFLDDNGHDLILVNSVGSQVRLQDEDYVTRNRARMAVSLGCSRLLAESGYAFPLVWEDGFVGMEAHEIETVRRVLQEFARTSSQVLLLTSHAMVKQIFESHSIPCLDIPDRYSGEAYPSTPVEPVRKASRAALKSPGILNTNPVEYSSTTNWSDVNRDFDLAAMDQYGTDTNLRLGSGFRSVNTAIQQQAIATRSNRRTQSDAVASREQETESLRFYLEMSSRVEAAPTIGPKTAEKLEKIGVCTVSDLVEYDASEIAEQLGQRRIKSEDVANWQKQALLVCETPNLRGHDAQLLVACGVSDAVQLAGMQPDVLYEIIGPFAESKEGKKLLRGSTQPDLSEVRDWVRWAKRGIGSRNAA